MKGVLRIRPRTILEDGREGHDGLLGIVTSAVLSVIVVWLGCSKRRSLMCAILILNRSRNTREDEFGL